MLMRNKFNFDIWIILYSADTEIEILASNFRPTRQMSSQENRKKNIKYET